MATQAPVTSDTQTEQVMGKLLRVGVLTAALVVAAGGIVYICQHGSELADKHQFVGEPERLTHPVEVVEGALQFHGRALIQLGILLLIATPVARVMFSVYAFARQRDYVYVVITLIVLAILVYSLLSGYLSS